MAKNNYKIEEKPLVTGEKPGEKKGYIKDFITNTWVKATPEEIKAVQILSNNWLRIIPIQKNTFGPDLNIV